MANSMYPQQVEINEANISKLTDLLKQTYKDVVKEIETATDFGVKNRKAILSQIRTILTEAGTDVDKFIKDELPTYYKQGADQAVKQLNNVGADVAVDTGFNQVHKQAIMALVDDTSRAFGESLTGVGRSADLLLGRATRDLITQNIAKGITAGEALNQVRQTIKGTLQEQGLSALKDKGGKSWSLDTYAEMLFRTKAVEARNRGLANRIAENEYDLVQVSSHGADDVCGKWEGEILSITGETDGYSTVADAEADGLFHPNCKHAINVLIPRLANMTSGYNLDEETKVIDPKELDKPKELAPPIEIGRGANKAVIDNVTKSESDFIKARDLQIETISGKNKFGQYSISLNDNNNKIKVNVSAIRRQYPDDPKKFAQGVKRTFYHEYGHFIDRRLENEALKDAYYGTASITNKPEVRAMLDTTLSEGKAVLRDRLARAYSGADWKVWGVTEDKIDTLLNYGSIDIEHAVTGRKGTYRIDYKTMTYFKSKKEMFADAYAQYRTQPEKFKEYAPKLTKYFDELVTSLPAE